MKFVAIKLSALVLCSAHKQVLVVIILHRLFIDISEIFEPTFVVIFSWSFASIFGTVILIQMEIVEYY